MAIRITEIHVQKLGPIDQLSIRPGQLTFIYVQNERGKTFLVEFLIRSLFRHKGWQTRSLPGSGRVTIEGLEEKPSFFSPSSPKKLEDFLEKREFGLPPDFSKLLVVKGAEVELVQSEGGVDRSVLKLFLSGADVLERIQHRISETLQSASLEKGLLIGKKTGELKERAKLEEELRTLERLFDQMDKGYSGGPCALLQQEKAQIEEELASLECAKRYEAFSLSSAIQDLEKKKTQIDENMLNRLRQKVHHYFQKAEEIQRSQSFCRTPQYALRMAAKRSGSISGPHQSEGDESETAFSGVRCPHARNFHSLYSFAVDTSCHFHAFFRDWICWPVYSTTPFCLRASPLR